MQAAGQPVCGSTAACMAMRASLLVYDSAQQHACVDALLEAPVN